MFFYRRPQHSINSTIMGGDDVVQYHTIVRMLLVVARHCLFHEQVRYTFRVECDQRCSHYYNIRTLSRLRTGRGYLSDANTMQNYSLENVWWLRCRVARGRRLADIDDVCTGTRLFEVLDGDVFCSIKRLNGGRLVCQHAVRGRARGRGGRGGGGGYVKP